MAALADGEPFAVMGLARVEQQAVLFSDYIPERKPLLRERAVIKGIFTVAELMRSRRVPTLALADKNEPDSDRLLQRLGFTLVEQTEDGGLYRWHS